MEMFPKLDVDFVTSALLSTDGDFDRALPVLVTEHEIIFEREKAAAVRRQATSPRPQPAPAARVSDDALDSPQCGKVENVGRTAQSPTEKAATPTVVTSNSTQRSTNDTASASTTSTNAVDALDDSRLEKSLVLTGEAKYKKMEPIVRQLCDSFPHVPLDDVWTAVITCHGNRVDASAKLLTFEQPATPVLVPLADRAELDDMSLRASNENEAYVPPLEASRGVSASRMGMQKSADDLASIAYAEAVTAQVPAESADAVLARKLQDAELNAANEKIHRVLLNDAIDGGFQSYRTK